MLDADREPQQRRRRAVRGVDRVAGPALDQRLDAAEAGRVTDQPHRLAHPLGVVGRPGDLEGDHRTVAMVQPRRQFVPRVRSQPREAHPRHRRVRAQAGRQVQRVGLGPLQPDGQRAQPTQREVGLQRPRHGAGEVAAQREAGAQRRGAGDQHAHQQVGMPGEVLRRRVHDDVGAVLERAHHQRRRERRVDAGDRAHVVRRGDEGGQVGHAHQRIGHRLQPQQIGTGQRRDDGRGVGDVDGAHLHPAHPLLLVEERHAARIAGAGHDGYRPGRLPLRDRRDRRHAAAERERGTALERPHRILERANGVAAALAQVVVVVGSVLERRRQHDRGAHRCPWGAWWPAARDDDGFGMKRNMRHQGDVIASMTVDLPDSAKKLLDAAAFVIVATLMPDGSPQTSVLWATYDGDDVLFATVVGRAKERNLRRDPRISVLIYDAANAYSYVEVRGRATLSTDGGPELIERLSQTYTGKPYTNDEGTDNVRVVVRVTPERVVEY